MDADADAEDSTLYANNEVAAAAREAAATSAAEATRAASEEGQRPPHTLLLLHVARCAQQSSATSCRYRVPMLTPGLPTLKVIL